MRKATKPALFVASLVLALGSWTSVRGDEPCDCPAKGVPVLAKIPYISRLFKNVGVTHKGDCEAACSQGACRQQGCPTAQEAQAGELLGRIGVDFEICPDCPEGLVLGLPFPLTAVGADAACCKDGACCKDSDCCREGKCGVAVTVCGTSKCGKSECCANKCGSCPETTQVAACKSSGCCESASCECSAGKCCGEVAAVKGCDCVNRDSLWEHIVELAAGKAAAEAALEAREESADMIDSLVELAAENAALHATLAAHEEHKQLAEQVTELAAENARLKTQVELAGIKAELLKESVQVAVDKELLARRVAELEARLAHGTPTHGAPHHSDTRAAKQPSAKTAR